MTGTPVAFELSHVDHVEVFVRDVASACVWYHRVLGLTEVRRWDPPGPTMIGAGGTMLALFAATREGPDNADDDSRPVIRWRRVAWRVTPKEFAAAQKHLRECGVVFTGPVDHDASLSVYFNDPDGNPLEITCYP